MKETILKNAIILFKQKGFSKVSVAEICEACNVTKGSFYHHYNSKNDLLTKFYKMMMKDYISKVNCISRNDSIYEQVWEMVEYIYNLTVDIGFDLFKVISLNELGYNYGKAMMKSKKMSLESKAYFDLMVKYIEMGKKYGEIRNGADTTEMIHTMLACFNGLWADWNFNNGQYDMKDKLKKQYDVIFKP